MTTNLLHRGSVVPSLQFVVYETSDLKDEWSINWNSYNELERFKFIEIDYYPDLYIKFPNQTPSFLCYVYFPKFINFFPEYVEKRQIKTNNNNNDVV